MADREVDQQLVERAQRGDKRAFELLVLKYQRKLGRLLSRLVRDPGERNHGEQIVMLLGYGRADDARDDRAADHRQWFFLDGGQRQHRHENDG